MRSLSEMGLFLLDMDGTFYLGDSLLPGAGEFLRACRKRNIPYMFVTNNSSKSGASYIQKLAKLGITVQRDEIFTSGDATLLYMCAQGLPRDILLVGTEDLEAEFVAEGYDTRAAHPRAVVLGFDTGIDYAKLTALCNAVREGLPYIATHPDLNCPAPGGYIPDIGAVIAFVQAATGRLPDVVVGKPNAGIAEAAAARYGLPLEALCMVGDRLYTDIALGRCGVHTALVMCGETDAAALASSDIVPDYVFANLAEMAQLI